MWNDETDEGTNNDDGEVNDGDDDVIRPLWRIVPDTRGLTSSRIDIFDVDRCQETQIRRKTKIGAYFFPTFVCLQIFAKVPKDSKPPFKFFLG